MNDIIPTLLVDESAPPEEVNNDMRFLFISVNDDVDVAGEDEIGEEGEWDDETETDNEQGYLHLHDDDDDDDDENDDEGGGAEDDTDN